MSESLSEYRASLALRKAADDAWMESVKAGMSPAEYAFRRAWYDYRYPVHAWSRSDTDELERPLFITPCPGAYDSPACAVVTIEGSPPVGIFLVTTDLGLSESRVYILGGYSSKPTMINSYRPVKGQKLRKAIIALLIERGVGSCFA